MRWVAEDACEIEADASYTRCRVCRSPQLQQPSLMVGVSWISCVPRVRVAHETH